MLLPEAHGADRPALEGMHRLDVRDAGAWAHLLGGVDVVCHQAAMVGAGVTVADLPSYAAHNDLGTAALLAAMTAEGVGRLVLASSMVVYGEGRYVCPEHGAQRPAPRAVEALDARRVRQRLSQAAGRPWPGQLVDEDARLDPRSSYAASKVAQEHYAAAWARQAPGAVDRAEVPQRLRAGDAARHALLRRRRDLPLRARARAEAPEVFEDGGQMRDFVHVADVARANLLAVEAVTQLPHGGQRPTTSCSGRPVSVLEVARSVSRGTANGAEGDVGEGPEPIVTGRYRPGDVRHVVASPDRARVELGFTAEVEPDEGLRAFAHAPLRT